MTQLERELQQSLKLQEELFSKELKTVTKTYEKHLAQITDSYKGQMNEALKVIERQNKTLEKYESISTNWQISIDEEQLQQLQTSHSNLTKRLDALEEQDKVLLEQLKNVLRKL